MLEPLQASRGSGADLCIATIYQNERFRFSKRAVRLFFSELSAGGSIKLKAWVDNERGRIYFKRDSSGNVLRASTRDGSATITHVAAVRWLRDLGDARGTLPVNWDGQEEAIFLVAIKRSGL